MKPSEQLQEHHRCGLNWIRGAPQAEVQSEYRALSLICQTQTLRLGSDWMRERGTPLNAFGDDKLSSWALAIR